MFGIDELAGLPLHTLVVHFAVVLVPLGVLVQPRMLSMAREAAPLRAGGGRRPAGRGEPALAGWKKRPVGSWHLVAGGGS